MQNNNMNWFAISVRSGKEGVPENSIYNIKDKIVNDPFFGIYKMKMIGEGTLTPELLLYAKTSQKNSNNLDEDIEKFLKSDLVGAASYRIIRGVASDSDVDINISNLNQFKDIISGKEIGPTNKENIKNQIVKENIRIAEIATIHVQTISFDENNECYLITNIGHVDGLIKQSKFNAITDIDNISSGSQVSNLEKSMGLSINNIDLINTPASGEKKIPIPDGIQYLNQEKLLEYTDLIENKAKNIAKELWEQQRHLESSYKKFVQRDIIEKYSTFSEEISQQSGNQIQELPSENITIFDDDLKDQEEIEKKNIEIPEYKIIDYGINLGKEGNIRLHLAIEVEGVTEEPKIAVIDITSDELKKPGKIRKPQTLLQLIKPEGLNYIADILDTAIDDYIGTSIETEPWKGRVITKIIFPSGGDIPISKKWNTRYYFYLREINTEVL